MEHSLLLLFLLLQHDRGEFSVGGEHRLQFVDVFDGGSENFDLERTALAEAYANCVEKNEIFYI